MSKEVEAYREAVMQLLAARAEYQTACQDMCEKGVKMHDAEHALDIARNALLGKE